MKRNKLNLKFVKILGIILTLQGMIFSPNFAQAQPPNPPDRHTPDGDTRPGTTRPQANCQTKNPPLTAIFANQGKDFTVSEYPTFWFYIPYATEDIEEIEFILNDPNGRGTIYQTTVQPPQQPGIIKIKIPSLPEYALKLYQDYPWHLNLDCKPDSTIEPDLVVRGWVRRVPNNSSIESQTSVNFNRYLDYRQNEIWYDAITELAELWFANPNNPELNKAWGDLLKELGFKDIIKELGFEDIVSKPFVQSQQLESPEF